VVILLKTVFLGILQGTTEFLPVSSSGHLLIGQYLMKFPTVDLSLSIVLHVGTLFAIVLYLYPLWSRLLADGRNIIARKLKVVESGWLMVVHAMLGTVPAVLYVLLLKDYVSPLSVMPLVAGICFLVNAAFL